MSTHTTFDAAGPPPQEADGRHSAPGLLEENRLGAQDSPDGAGRGQSRTELTSDDYSDLADHFTSSVLALPSVLADEVPADRHGREPALGRQRETLMAVSERLPR